MMLMEIETSSVLVSPLKVIWKRRKLRAFFAC
jgi:hypothetical protein